MPHSFWLKSNPVQNFHYSFKRPKFNLRCGSIVCTHTHTHAHTHTHTHTHTRNIDGLVLLRICQDYCCDTCSHIATIYIAIQCLSSCMQNSSIQGCSETNTNSTQFLPCCNHPVLSYTTKYKCIVIVWIFCHCIQEFFIILTILITGI